MTVKQLLNLCDDEEYIMIHFFAYGVYYANSKSDGMVYVSDCKQNLNIDCKQAKVTHLTVDEYGIVAKAEMVKG